MDNQTVGAAIRTISADDISDFFARYKTNLDIRNAGEESLFDVSDKYEWLQKYSARSAQTREIFAENTRGLSEIIEPLVSGRTPMSDSVAERLYDEIIALEANISSYDDPFVAIGVVDALIAYYKPLEDHNRLIRLYNRLGWELVAAIRMGWEDEEKRSLDAYLNVLAYKDIYSQFDDALLRSKVFIAYYNITCVLPSFDVITIEQSYAYLREMNDFYATEAVQRLDAETPTVTRLMNMSREMWLSYEFRIDGCPAEVRDYFCELAHKNYERHLAEEGGKVCSLSVEAVLAYQHALVLEGTVTHLDALQTLLNCYDERRVNTDRAGRKTEFEIDGDFYLQTRLPDALVYQWLDKRDVPEQMRQRERARLIDCKTQYLSGISRTRYSPFINQSLTTWCFETLKYRTGADEKIRSIINLVVDRQPATYIHSRMVAEIARAITGTILAREPSLLIGICGAQDALQVSERPEEIYRYVERCAMLHDIGKNSITDIINTQHRRLTAEEFGIIRRHTELAAHILCDDELSAYRDVVLGHHKSFDGRSGYPASFDNTASPVKAVIDLITVCDTIDAATDRLGRNYATGKDMTSLLRELQAEKGTRYSDRLIDLIASDEALVAALDELTTDGRRSIYYDIYSAHFDAGE